MAIIKKVPLDEIIDVFMDLYNKGVDFIDIIASEKDNRISVIFTEEYINQEAIDNFELDDNNIEIDINTKLTDEDFNQLI
jgi:2-hydroxy-3-keto-5-methylthiopentenyl-1-phosphate phosphatase